MTSSDRSGAAGSGEESEGAAVGPGEGATKPGGDGTPIKEEAAEAGVPAAEAGEPAAEEIESEAKGVVGVTGQKGTLTNFPGLRGGDGVLSLQGERWARGMVSSSVEGDIWCAGSCFLAALVRTDFLGAA